MANSNGWGDGAANNAIGWGQGANNNIGWGKSHSLSSAGLTDIVGLTTDSDAQAFITAAAITDATQQSAIDTLVKGLKTDGLWSKMKAVYPFVTDNRNLLGYTTTFTSPNYVTDSTATFTLNNTTAPDGSNTGVRFTAVGSNNNYFYSANTAGGNNFGTGNKAYSIYVKAGTFSGSSSIGITSDGSTIRTNFTLTNDWQRITLTRNVIVAGNGSQYYIDLSGASMTSGQYFYIWAPQFENGTTATTYQPIATTQQAYIASQFKYNLVNPIDSDAAFRLVFNGGWTHSSTGATPNGTNGYANTYLNISSEFTSQTQAFSLYTPVSNTTSNVLGGVTNGVSTTQFFNPIGQYNILGTGYVKSSAMSNGFILMSQPSFNNTSAYEKGVKLGTFTQATSSLMNLNYYIGARNFSNTADSYANRQFSFAHVGNGLTDTEASNLYTRVQAFQTALSRQV